MPLPMLKVPLLFNWTSPGSTVTLPQLSLGTEERQITLDG